MLHKTIAAHRIMACVYFVIMALALVDIYFGGLLITNIVTGLIGAFMWLLYLDSIHKLKKLAKLEQEGLNI